MSVLQRIAEVEAEMARTQKNKATNYHLGLLKAKLAKLRAQLVSFFSELKRINYENSLTLQ
jgi:uncharacterized protein